MIIKEANTGAIKTIQKLAYDTWPVVYKKILSEAQLEYMLQLFYSIESLETQMQNGQRFFIAYQAEEPVGFASFTTEGEGVFKLQKLYVLPNMQKLGLGKGLLQHVESEILRLEGHSLVLNVNRNNPAKDYYCKNGFIVSKLVDNDIGNGFWMNDFVMEKKLSSPGI
jgi:diamine N-acetyltransferase